MNIDSHVGVIELASLHWPDSIRIPSNRFRLFVAADADAITSQVLAEFASAAMKRGMVYFSAWGPNCERFHDIVDEVIVEDTVFGNYQLAGPSGSDTIMTSWHAKDTLDEALDFFFDFACPSGSFTENSDYWLAVCVSNATWATIIRRRAELANSKDA